MTVTSGCMKIVQDKSSEECQSIGAQARTGGFDFGNVRGLLAADEALVKLDVLCVFTPGDAAAIKLVLRRDFDEFVALHRTTFQTQEAESSRAVSMEAMLDAFKNLLPVAKAEGLRRLPRDPKLLEYLTRGANRAEASLMVLADERLDNKEITLLLRNMKHILVYKHMDESQTLGAQVVGLQDARAGLMQRLDRALQEAKAAMEQARFDAVADFAEHCSESECKSIFSDANHSLRSDIRVTRKLVNQISWLEADQIQRFCETFERIEECSRSSLFRILDQSMQAELRLAQEEVRSELSSYPSKFREVLARIISKKACYGECDSHLKVIVSIKCTFPEYFKEASAHFDDHVMTIQDMFDGFESADDPTLQRLAIDVVEVMSDLNVHGTQSPVWRAFDSSWRSLRGVMDPKVSSVVKMLKERATLLIDSGRSLELAIRMLNTHDRVLDYAVKAGYPSSHFADAASERRAVLEMQRVNAETFRANLRKGDFEAAMGVMPSLTDEERSEARKALEAQVRELKRDTEEAMAGGVCRVKLAKGIQHLQRLRLALDGSRLDQHLQADLEYFLKEVEERCNAVAADVFAELEKLSQKDVVHSLRAWAAPLEKVKKILEYPPELGIGLRDQIIDIIAAFASRLHGFVQTVIQDVANDSKSLELHALKKIWGNLEQEDLVLRLMEDICKTGQNPVGANLSSICPDSKHALLQILSLKSDEAVKLVADGIPDKGVLSRIMSTLQQAANEQFTEPIGECITKVSEIFERLVAEALSAWELREEGWGDLVNALVRILQMGQGAFANIKTLSKVAIDALDNVLKPIKAEINRQSVSIGANLGSSGEIAQQLLQLRAMAGDVDMLHDYTKQAIRDLLSRLQASRAQDATFLSTLGEALAATDDPLGKALIVENSHVFQRLSNMLYNQHMKDKATLDIKHVIKNMSDMNPSAKLDCARLEDLYSQYLAKYSSLIMKYVKNTTKPLQLRENELVSALRDLVKKKHQVDLVEFLANVSALYSFCKSAQHYGTGADESCIVKPHEIQISSILRLLSIDSADKGIWKKIFNSFCRGKSSGSDSIENHFMQVPTGEGKSIILGITATMFSLQGWLVDCVCYSKYLSGRDENDFKDVFRLLKKVSPHAGDIRYMTFEDLCESHIEGIREAVECVIYGREVAASQDPTKAKRLLLIDEADVFFTKRFYGNKHCPGFRLRSPEITALIRSIWDSRRAPPSEGALLSSKEYGDVVAKFACVEPILRHSALAMARNAQDMSNPKFDWTFNKGQLGYLVAGEFVPATKLSHQNRTVFAFLKEEENRNPHVTDEVLDQMVGIDVKCGEFSYAALPTRYYSKIFGVTGTLETLSAEEKELLREEYSITKETLVPSAYGSQRLRLNFCFEDDKHAIVADDEANWFRSIDQEVALAVGAGRAVLVCFKNDRALQGFVAATLARPLYAGAKRLDANVEDADVQYIGGIVANAGLPGKVTLLTRKFGRGLDFKPSKAVNASGGVLVVQTFYSSAESEQIQVMGRTARQGEQGSYRLILCAEHLQAKFGVAYKAGTSNKALKAALEAARADKLRSKFEGRAKMKAEADRADAQSWELATVLYGRAGAGEKLRLLNSLSLSGAAMAMTFVLVLDVSGSMEGHYDTLREAFDAFLAALRAGGHGAGTLVTVLLFSSDAKTLFVDRALPDVAPLAAANPCGGGTSFRAAFALCHREIAAARGRDPGRRFAVLFMTDGEDNRFNPAQLEPVVHDVGAQVAAFSGISFGDGASDRLVGVAAAFVAAGSGTRARVVNPRDAGGLVEAFAAAAGDATLRMR